MPLKPYTIVSLFTTGLSLISLTTVPPSFAQVAGVSGALHQAAAGSGTPLLDASLPMLQLTVVATPQVKDARLGQGTSRIGPLDPVTTPQAEQTFLLKNQNAHPVTIARLRASCGCESLLLLQRGVPATSVTLAPGEEVSVRMAVKLAGQHGGLLHKYAWVYAPKSDTPLASLEMLLTLRTPVSCSPEVVNFGSGPAGISRSLQVTITADRSVLAGSVFPLLTSDSRDVQVTAVGEPTPAARDGQPSLVQKYQVILKAEAPAGHLQGHLRFSSSSTSGALGAAVGSTPAFGSISLPIAGEVLGRFSATPQTLFFGSILSGKEVTRQIILTGPSSDSLTDLRLSTGGQWLSIHLGQPRPAGAGSPFLCPLEVTLSAHAPVGPSQEQITLTTGKGDRLVIPVIWETVRRTFPLIHVHA